MNKAIIKIFMIVALFSIIDARAEEKKDVGKSDWIDITDKLYANASDQSGWNEDSKGKIYRDADGSNLKLTTSKFGDFKVDLKATKVFELKSDGSTTEILNAKLLQRDNGISLVIRTEKVKIRCKFTEKLKTLENLPGMKSMD
jgi:hypothetical protein